MMGPVGSLNATCEAVGHGEMTSNLTERRYRLTFVDGEYVDITSSPISLMSDGTPNQWISDSSKNGRIVNSAHVLMIEELDEA